MVDDDGPAGFVVPARITQAKVTPRVEDGDLVRTITFGVEVREDELRLGQCAAPGAVMAQLTDLSDAPVVVTIVPRAIIAPTGEPNPQTRLFDEGGARADGTADVRPADAPVADAEDEAYDRGAHPV
ncbi:MAG: hypothetical protein QN174_07675 [Armatimonadota bacterium]|nr:hypothetical protein [Armatimonadota bacterium]